MDLLLLVAVAVAVSPTAALLFEPDPCPNDVHCTCPGFSVMCNDRDIAQVPDFTVTWVRYTLLDLSNNNLTDVGPAAFSNVTTTGLVLSHNPLQTVAVDAFHGLEDVLETLELEDCLLSEVPAAVGLLRRLRVLNLRHNALITFLPGSVMAAVGVTLESLDFSNTGISTWPLALKTPVRLKRLLSSGNHLTSIPDGSFLSFAATLEYLDLSYNALRTFPDAVNDLRTLKHLDLSFNLFGTIPAGKFRYSRHTLQTLYLVHVMMREIPPGLRDLYALQNLYLSYNPISSANDDVFQGRIASSLKVLHIDKTLLTTVPSALTYLTALTELNVTWNRIQYLENYAIDLRNLETLYLDKNPITNVKFAAFSGLPKLKRLYMRNTSLTFVPNAAFARVPSLTFLDLSFNHFRALYDYGFPGMSGLHELVMSGNPLVNVSGNAFDDLTGVSVLNLNDCLLTEVPRAVEQMHALRTLRVDRNDIECTCANLGWVNVWRANQGLIAKIEGQCAGNETVAIQTFVDSEGISCS